MFINRFKTATVFLNKFVQEVVGPDISEAEKHKQFAAWIRTGSEEVYEQRSVFVARREACAIGSAWYGQGKDHAKWWKEMQGFMGMVTGSVGINWITASEHFDISQNVLRRISEMHHDGIAKRHEIADMLDRGYFLKL